MKKLLTAVLTVAILLSMTVLTVFAAEPSNTINLTENTVISSVDALKDGVTIDAGTHTLTFCGLTNATFNNVTIVGGNVVFDNSQNVKFTNAARVIKDLVSLTVTGSKFDINVTGERTAINVVGDAAHQPYAVTIPAGSAVGLLGKKIRLAANSDANGGVGGSGIHRYTIKGVV